MFRCSSNAGFGFLNTEEIVFLSLPSSCLSEFLMPLAPHRNGRRRRALGLGHELDHLVDRRNRVQCLIFGRLQENQRVGRVFLSERPGFVVSGSNESCGGGGFEAERRWVVGLEEGE